MSIKILIVDDDADLRSSLASVLAPLFGVIEASNGASALDIIKRERPRLVLLDVSMPGMSGLEVLEAARALDPSTIVVMLTSQKEIDMACQALSLGAVEYVTKPFDADYIRGEVSRLLGAPKPSNDKPWRVIQ